MAQEKMEVATGGGSTERGVAGNKGTATADSRARPQRTDAVTLWQMRRVKVASRSTSQGTGRKRA